MAISSPAILLPSGGVDYTTDTSQQTLSGTCSATSSRIQVNGSTLGVSYTAGDTIWSWTGTIDLGVNAFSIIAIEKITGDQSPPSTIDITLIAQDVSVSVSAPTGVVLKRYQDKLEPICSKNPESTVVGYNFYVSYQSGGVNNVYVKINPQLVNTVTYSEQTTKQISQTVDTVGNIRITTTTEEIDTVQSYSAIFDKAAYTSMVSAGTLPSTGFTQQTSFYFVITAVIFDPVFSVMTESPYSVELEGSPISITSGIQDLPPRTQNDIISTFTKEIISANPGVNMNPGTVMRDTVNPISEEQERIYVIQDFLARALSVSALLDFDDANGDGVSDPVDQSPKKKALQVALYLQSADDTQRIVDDQFDKMAANVNVIRRQAAKSYGTVIFYTTVPPIRDMQVTEGAIVTSTGNQDQGIPSQPYRCSETKVLQYATRESFYNTTTKRYELEIAVEAFNAGTAGNTASYTISTVTSGADSDFLVENPNPISFGYDLESNHSMASRYQLAYYADTGTAGGYARTTVAVPGVQGVRVEKAGDPLMWRDYEPTLNEHIGGKVDVYVQGVKTKQVADQIAFSYANGTGGLSGEQFLVINAITFQFKTENSRVTASTPIFEVSRVYNSTRAAAYDISGYQVIGDGDTIDLNENLPTNIAIGLATSDVIKVDYKYRSSDVFVLKNQPVENAVSIVGQLSGTLTSANWELVKLQDPGLDGGSTIASDGIRILYANNLPVTDFQTITDESHILIQGVDEPLDFMGIDSLSVVVTNSDKNVTYVQDQDYTLSPGSDTEKAYIRILDTGAIVSGQEVLVSYIAMENFTITYTINSLLQDVQTQLDQMKHACADVIAKKTVLNSIDFILTIVPKTGVVNFTVLTSQIQTALANYISQLGVGISLSQSEVVHIIQGIPDVDYVVVPFIKMAKADGSFIVRDNLGTPTFQVYNVGLSTSYVTTVPVLAYSTVDKGGPENMFRGVFENNMALMLQGDPLDVSGGPGRAYIQADGRIVVSTRDGNLPNTKSYQASYYVYGEKGASDINVNSLEYLKIGTFSISYDTPRQITRQTF